MSMHILRGFCTPDLILTAVILMSMLMCFMMVCSILNPFTIISVYDEFIDLSIFTDFRGDEQTIAQRCIEKGLEFVVVNGLEPVSNREVLALSDRFPALYLPALGNSSNSVQRRTC